MMRSFLMLLLTCAILSANALSQTDRRDAFALHDQDRVVFYGDSITEQRLYTRFLEDYAVTRFPERKIEFRNAGVGGDKVSGGWAGPVDLRVTRDLLAYHPTVVTIMLGMNDGYYRAYDPGIFSTYADGYRRLVEEVLTKDSSAHLTLIGPSPYDDATHPPAFPGGYNGVMQRFTEFLSHLAQEKNLGFSDFNAPVVQMLERANKTNAALATSIIPDRVHPGMGGHWTMAEALIRSWHGANNVSAVTIDAAKLKATQAENTTVTELKKSGNQLQWTQQDKALPLPLPPSIADPIVDLAITSSDLVQALDRETLQVTGLPEGAYRLTIDQSDVATFRSSELAAGINLAQMDTPMLAQARLVDLDVDHKNMLEAARFRFVHEDMDQTKRQSADALDAAFLKAMDQEYKDAQPRTHRYLLIPVRF